MRDKAFIPGTAEVFAILDKVPDVPPEPGDEIYTIENLGFPPVVPQEWLERAHREGMARIVARLIVKRGDKVGDCLEKDLATYGDRETLERLGLELLDSNAHLDQVLRKVGLTIRGCDS